LSHPVAGENSNVGNLFSKSFYNKMRNKELISNLKNGQKLINYYVEQTAKTLYWRAYKGMNHFLTE